MPSSGLVAPRAVIASPSDAYPEHPARPRTEGDSASDAASPAVPTGDARFQRDARLTTPAEFERCLKRPALYRSGAFAFHLCPADADRALSAHTPAWRLGLVIPKRYEASAVARNTIKRRWRDAFRRMRAALACEFGSADLVVRLQSPLVPKAKPSAKGRATPGPATLPARVRGRDRFDPNALLVALVERVRGRSPGRIGEAGA